MAESLRLRAPIMQFWRGLDKPLLYPTLALVLIGIVLSFAAGPVAALRNQIENPMHFVQRQLIFLLPALLLMLAAAALTPLQVRRAGVVIAAGSLFLMLIAVLFGPEINGAHRWLPIGSFGLQPSEFFKPGFVIFVSWMLAESARDPNVRGGLASLSAFLAAAFILILQPDYGQVMLLIPIWATVFFVAGWSWSWIIGLGALIPGVIGFGYLFAPHFRSRIDRFIAPATGDNYQTDIAVQAIAGGGWGGRGLGDPDGVKEQLPDAHTDFVFAVAGEEWGFFACLLIIALYALIVIRAILRAVATEAVFVRCATVGLAALIGFQATINIAVSLALIPAKGMTLPFISYGGSSLLATGLSVGFLLALTRSRGDRA